MALSTQLKAAILADFAYQYNKRWGENWTIEVKRFAEIYRPGTSGKYTCTGHFIKALFDYCDEHLGINPCISCFDEQIRFYL